MPIAIVLQKSEATIINAAGKLEFNAAYNPNCKATQTTPRWDLLNKDSIEPLALDIEFQTCKAKNDEKLRERMGRVSIVNTKGEEDEEDLTVRSNPRFGVTWKGLKICNGAQWITVVEGNLEKIMDGRVIVGHGMRNDLKSIGEKLRKVATSVVDIHSLYGGQIALGTLVDQHLKDFDFVWHNPTEDAKATMLLYLLKRPYKGRSDFTEKFVLDDEEFPALGAPQAKK